MIYAKVIADSVTKDGDRLTTMEVEFHRFILAEFNTHRVFSRNSASSRAIPTKKQIERILFDPAMPVEWGTLKAGMQAGPPLEGFPKWRAERRWRKASRDAVRHAKKLNKLGVHKQVTNRLLEPFMWHKVIVTSTTWENFFQQRCSILAQPEIHAAALEMREAYRNSVPKFLTSGEYHLPYLDEYMDSRYPVEDQVKFCVARCARVSYNTHDGERNVVKDLELFNKLVSADPPHWSPLEHVATPMSEGLDDTGNFTGFAQIRHNLHLIL